MVGYRNSIEHLFDELKRIDVMIRFQVSRFRMRAHGDMDEFKGLYIKEEEVDTILAEKDVIGAQLEKDPDQLKPFLEHRAALETRISEKKVASLREGTILRLEQLKELYPNLNIVHLVVDTTSDLEDEWFVIGKRTC